MRKLIPIFLLAVVLFASCEEKENVKETLRLMQSHPVCLPLDEMQCCFRGNDTVMLDSIKMTFVWLFMLIPQSVLLVSLIRCLFGTIDLKMRRKHLVN